MICLLAFIPGAQAQRLAVDLSSSEVAISTCSRAELLLFGAMEGNGDIVVTVIGPHRDEVVRRKERLMGIWVNGASVTFKGAPPTIVSLLPGHFTKSLRRKFSISLKSALLKLSCLLGRRGPAEIIEFRKALIRNKKRLRLYSEDIFDIKIVRDLLFRSTIPFPANVPIGDYGECLPV